MGQTLARGDYGQRLPSRRKLVPGRDEIDVLRDAHERLRELTAERNRQLVAMATTDPLTGLLNRRAFEARLDAEWQRSRRYGRPLSVLVLDIDELKQVNDKHGHEAGDRLLRVAAHTLTEAIRAVDHVARIGGDEFSIVMPETDADGAARLAERIEAALGNSPVEVANGVLAPVRASIGRATAVAGDPGPAEALLSRADVAMYDVKRRRPSSRSGG